MKNQCKRHARKRYAKNIVDAERHRRTPGTPVTWSKVIESKKSANIGDAGAAGNLHKETQGNFESWSQQKLADGKSRLRFWNVFGWPWGECEISKNMWIFTRFSSKICKNIYIRTERAPKLRNWIPRRAKVSPRAPKVSQSAPKVSQGRGAKGGRKGAETEPNAGFLEPKPQTYDQKRLRESMKNRGCVADSFLERFGAAPGRQKGDRINTATVHFRSHFRPKIEKMVSQSYPKINAERVSKIDAKMIPKWCQNGCPNQWFLIPIRKRRKATKLLNKQIEF